MSPLSEAAHGAIRVDMAGPNVGNMGGRFRYSNDTEENREAQRTLYNRNPSLLPADVDTIAESLQPGYGEIVEGMYRGHQAVLLDQIGQRMEEKKKVVIDMNHPGLINAGIGFRALCSALESMGVNFETVSVEGAMLAHLKVWLSREAPPPLDESDESEETADDGFMPTQNGVALISQHALKTIPNTDNTKKFREKFEDEVKEHTGMFMQTFKGLMEQKIGMVVLIIGSGTHDKHKPGDPSVIEMKPPAEGLIKMFVDYELEVAQMAVVDMPDNPFDIQLVEGPQPVTTMEQMNRRKARLARFLTDQVAGVTYEYRDSGLLVPED